MFLVRYLASIHMLGWTPHLIVVDDLSMCTLTDKIKAVALLQNAVQLFDTKLRDSEGTGCKYLVSESVVEDKVAEQVGVWDRLLPVIFTTSPLNTGTVELMCVRAFKRRDPYALRVLYSFSPEGVTINLMSARA